ncbi:hypothetical protein BROUX41_002352 [Berkeleyomyces rouxiae]|uniref:uncharacterized protein n=1 Tax=Berkeleyomyces rouxiae TaxID=2035830 RepID=UPI003B828804
MYWLAVVFVGVSYRVFGAAWARCLPSLPPPKTPTDEPAVYTPPAAGPSSWLRRFVLLPATVGHRKAQPFGWFTVPPRAQSATLALFVVLNVWFTVDGYYFTDKNIYFPTYQKQFWRYLSDRTGFISYANFPMVWVFGLRNNLLLWLTGWDFGTYNNFHRWAARVATVQAVIHSVGYTVLVFIDGGWPYFFFFFTKFFWWTGEIAVLGMCALLPLSLYWMRRNMYEVFLALHIALSAIVLVCMWGHLTIFKSQTNSVFWLCCIFWIGDRLGRVLRVVAFNPRFWSSRATVSWSSAANMLRLNVPIASSLYQPQAGTFYYIYVLNSRYFWQSHPFTVATISSSTAATTTASPLPDDSSTPLLGHVAAPKPAEMTFLIRPYAGFTNRLKAIAQHGPATLRVLIEGPYGHTAPLATFNTCLFLVGGSGIAAPLSHLRRLVAAQRAVRIVWAVRESALVTEVLACDFAGLLCAIGNNRSAISLDIYVTSDEARDVIAPQGIRVLAGRPEVRCEVEAAAAQTGAGRLAVLACGPAVMADDARAAVVEAVARGYTQTEYFEEAFNW